MAIDTADHVHHAPSGETWVVMFVDGDHLYYCGWPNGSGLLTDCKLTKKASAAERHKLLVDLAAGSTHGAAHAKRELERI
jgi:hypothetical protein